MKEGDIVILAKGSIKHYFKAIEDSCIVHWNSEMFGRELLEVSDARQKWNRLVSKGFQRYK